MFNLQFALQKSLVYLFTVILFSGSIQAREGMWLPFLIGQLNADEMTRMGMEISAEDIYSVNQSSLKDAIVHFGGGCTAELISDRGLLLTNHHCGYSRIQSHSSIENNYLKDGYWAMSAGEELTNPGLTASIVKFMEDVTNQVLTGVSEDLESAEREELIRANVDSLLASRQSDYELQILPFSYGNQYILIAKEKFKDVRLVGAPPSSIGKFGADTDNWMWPRHTGDFSLFRIYADANNKPAEFSPDNVPYQPLQHLKVNLSGFKPGDFTLVYGFPGTTKEYLPSNEMRYIIEAYDPVRINIREQLLEILDKKMRQSDATRIQYASKYASISNSWKKWKGEIKGMKRTNALGKKHQLEQEFTQALADNPAWQEAYGEVLPRLKELYEKRKPLMLERHIYIETNYFGNELIRHLLGYRQLIELYEQEKEEELAEAAAKKAEAIANFYEDYDAGLDQKGMQALLPIFLEGVHTEPYGETIAELKLMDPSEVEEFVEDLYADLLLVQEPEEWQNLLKEKPAKALKKLQKSEAMQLTLAGWDYFLNTINTQTRAYNDTIYPLQAQYLKAMQRVFPNKAIYPDANSSLRVSYGQVQGYEPRDAVTYEPQTFLSGVIAKYVPGDYEFDLPIKLIELYADRDYGRYGQQGKMPVCFIATNHTTGGNSGSPALNGNGELIGLNFDRAWEGTMSDYTYDPSICRNIMVDIRYVLFIIDKFAGAGYLVDEMDLVSQERKAPAPAEKAKPEVVPTEG